MMQVLLVDDSPVMRRFLARTLGMTGIAMTLYEAGNGLEAIYKAFEVRPDLIITDLNMPEMSGHELMLRIAAAPELQGTPVIVLSADRSAVRPAQSIDLGAAAYMTKPVTPEALRERLLEIMAARL